METYVLPAHLNIQCFVNFDIFNGELFVNMTYLICKFNNSINRYIFILVLDVTIKRTLSCTNDDSII